MCEMSIRRWFCRFALVLVTAAVGFSQAENNPSLPIIPYGIEYFHQRIGAGPLSIHWVRVDRSQSQFAFASSLAKKTVFDLEPLRQQVRALDPALGEPLAAVNGDFFRIRPGPYQGDPLGLQIIRGELVSSPKNTCFWIDTDGRPRIDYVHPAFHVTWPDGSDIKFAVNEECSEDAAVLYTPTIGPSTRTKNALEFVLEKGNDSEWLPVRPGRTYKGRIVSVNREGNSVIGPDKLVLSIGSARAGKIEDAQIGTVVSLSFKTTPDLTDVRTAIGGGPVLIRDGKIREFTGQQPRHPRTAIGWNDECFFLLVVDGRQIGLSIGMSFPELAEFMLKLGCTEAMNLDGGGSSTLWLDGKIMNSPSDRQERAVANGLILLKTK